MSRRELADAVNAYLFAEHGVHEHMNQDDVGRIERGVTRWPGEWRRAGCRAVLGVATDAELGFYFHRATSGRTGTVEGSVMPAPVSGSATAAAGGWERDEVVRAVLGISVLPLLASWLPDDQVQTERPDPSCRTYAEVTDRLWVMYWTAPAGQLFDVCRAHTEHGTELARPAAAADRADLARSLAKSAMLTARLAFFDLNQPGVADRAYRLALAVAGEAGDETLVAAVLGHMALIPAFARQPAQARGLIEAGLARSRRSVPLARSWLHCVASEVEARAGDGAASRRHIDRAEATLDLSEPAPEWLDFYDATRLDSFAGYAALVDGDRAEAVRRLTRCLTGLGTRGVKQQSVVLADLATLCGDDGDRAADYLDQAIDSLQTTWYRTGADRVRQARVVLADSINGRGLDERLAVLEAARADRHS